MTTSQKLVPLAEAMPGMVLSQALKDHKGDVLLPEGATLSESLLVSLQRRGVAIVPIAVEEEISEAEKAAKREHLQQRMASLFRKCGSNGANGLLLQYITGYWIGGDA